ncbi:hypothetical protein BSKO_05314 [Bryopsis sp. KO-2023]|nr:hypothetical protein BSKO_05314 [Bryopsis sp. KO-2023]
MTRGEDDIVYSERYYDERFEYRHVMLPKRLLTRSQFREPHLMFEEEWRALGVRQSRGWIHYAIHDQEPWILLFKRPKGFQQLTLAQQHDHICKSDHFIDRLNQRLAEWRYRSRNMPGETECPY